MSESGLLFDVLSVVTSIVFAMLLLSGTKGPLGDDEEDHQIQEANGDGGKFFPGTFCFGGVHTLRRLMAGGELGLTASANPVCNLRITVTALRRLGFRALAEAAPAESMGFADRQETRVSATSGKPPSHYCWTGTRWAATV